jgi:hypothetical protein
MRYLVALLLVLALGACSNPLADDPTLDAGPSRELAETPAELEPSAEVVPSPGEPTSAPTSDGDGAEDDGEVDGSGGSGSEGEAEGSDPEDPGGPDTSGARASVGDDSGDHGLRAPGYADIVAVSLVDGGDTLGLTFTTDGDIPERLPEDEVQGIGIDLYRAGAEESAYQVFVDGSPDGWFAYFSTPKGFEKYPGVFALGGNRMVFEVPWSALKLGQAFSFSAFCDWTRNTTGVVNLFAEDHAPDSGRHTFQR